jgi:hypothetical protein
MPQGCFYQSFSIKATHTQTRVFFLFHGSTPGAFSSSLVAQLIAQQLIFHLAGCRKRAEADLGRPSESSQCEILPAQARAVILLASVTTILFIGKTEFQRASWRNI